MNQATTCEQAAVAAPAVHQEFVTVPARTLKCGVAVAEFSVGKYLTRFNTDGSATIAADAVPTVRLTHEEARIECATAGLHMLTLTRSAALAEDIASVAVNWSSGVVGDGTLQQGLHLGTVSGAVDGNYVSPDESERRTFVLSNGDVIFDAAGHLYTRLFDDVHGDTRGLVATESFPEDSPAVCGAPAPSGEQGVGYYPDAGEDWSGTALIRGGYWCSDDYAGVFFLNYVWPGDGSDDVGVRCTNPGGL